MSEKSVLYTLSAYQHKMCDKLIEYNNTDTKQIVSDALDYYLVAYMSGAKILGGGIRDIIQGFVSTGDTKEFQSYFSGHAMWSSILLTYFHEVCRVGDDKALFNWALTKMALVDFDCHECFGVLCRSDSLEVNQRILQFLRTLHVPQATKDHGLTQAATSGNTGALRAILAFGPSVSGINDALYLACAHSNTDAAKLLIRENVPVNDTRAPLRACIAANNEELITMFLNRFNLSKAVMYSALGDAVAEGLYNTVTTLLMHGAPVNDEHGESIPLYTAVSTQNEALVSELLMHGADVSETAFKTAIALDAPNILLLLLSSGKADPGKLDKYMILSARAGSIQSMKLVMDYAKDHEILLAKSSDVVRAAITSNSVMLKWVLRYGFTNLSMMELAAVKNADMVKAYIRSKYTVLEPSDHRALFINTVYMRNYGLMKALLKTEDALVQLEGANAVVQAVNNDDIRMVTLLFTHKMMDTLAMPCVEAAHHPLTQATALGSVMMVKCLLKTKPGLVYVNYALGLAERDELDNIIPLLQAAQSR